MRKLLIFATLGMGLLAACSSNTEKEAEVASDTTMEQMEMSADTINSALTDSAKIAADKAAKDSADAAHGHSH